MKSLLDLLEAELDKKQIILQILQTGDIDQSTINKIYKLVSPMDNFEPKVEQGLIRLGVPEKSAVWISTRGIANDEDYINLSYYLNPNDRENPWYGQSDAPKRIGMGDLTGDNSGRPMDIYDTMTNSTKISRRTLENIAGVADMEKGLGIGKGEILLWIFGENAGKAVHGDISIGGNSIEVKTDGGHAAGAKKGFSTVVARNVYNKMKEVTKELTKIDGYSGAINNTTFQSRATITKALKFLQGAQGNAYDPVGFITTCIKAGLNKLKGEVNPGDTIDTIFAKKYSDLGPDSDPKLIADATLNVWGIYCLYAYLEIEPVDYFMIFQTKGGNVTGKYRILDTSKCTIDFLCKYDGIKYDSKIIYINGSSRDCTPEMDYKD